MITTIRSQFKQSTYRYVVFFMMFAIVTSMVSSLLVKSDRASSESWVMRVNGEEISYADFNAEVTKQTEYLSLLRAQYGQYAELLFQSLGWSLDPKTRALDMLIKEELIYQYGKKLGIAVSPHYLSTVINDASFVKQNLGHIIPPFVFDQAGMLNMDMVKSYLQKNNISARKFENSIEKALLNMQTLEIISSAHHVPLFDIQQQFIAKNLGKQFSYLVFPLDKFLAEEKKVAISDDELKEFYDAQNIRFRRYWVPEKRSATMWRFEPQTYNIVVSNEEIEQYYEDNKVKNYVLDPLKVEVEQIALNTITDSAASFDEIRQDLIDNPSSTWAKNWQKIKPFARSERKGELEKEAFILQNEGDISPVFQTNEGPMIIKLVRRIPRTYKPLAAVRNDIISILSLKAFRKNFTKDIKAIIQGNQEMSASFILEKGGKKSIVPALMKDESRLSQELFALKKGQYSFYLDNDTGVVLMLSEITDRYLPELNSIKDVVKADLQEERAQIKMANAAQQAQEAAQQQTFEELQDMFGVKLESTNLIMPNDHKALQSLDKKGLPVREMMALEKKGSLVMHNDDRMHILIRLNEIESFDENQFLAAKSTLEEQLGSIRKRLFTDACIASLHRNATIETNESIITKDEEYSE